MGAAGHDRGQNRRASHSPKLGEFIDSDVPYLSQTEIKDSIYTQYMLEERD